MSNANKNELDQALSAAISTLQALLNQQLEVAKATEELVKRFSAVKDAGGTWSPKDVKDYFDYLKARDDAVKAGATS